HVLRGITVLHDVGQKHSFPALLALRVLDINGPAPPIHAPKNKKQWYLPNQPLRRASLKWHRALTPGPEKAQRVERDPASAGGRDQYPRRQILGAPNQLRKAFQWSSVLSPAQEKQTSNTSAVTNASAQARDHGRLRE